MPVPRTVAARDDKRVALAVNRGDRARPAPDGEECSNARSLSQQHERHSAHTTRRTRCGRAPDTCVVADEGPAAQLGTVGVRGAEGEVARRRTRDTRSVGKKPEAILRVRTARNGRRAVRVCADDVDAVHRERDVVCLRALPVQFVDQVIAEHDDRAPNDQTRGKLGLRADPSGLVVVCEGEQRAVHARLRLATHERRIVRERAAVPRQRGVHVRTCARIVEPATRPINDGEIETVRVPMSTAGMPVVERHVNRALVAAQHAEALRRKEVGSQRLCDERGKRRQGAEQRAPREIGPTEATRGEIPLDIGRRRSAAGVAARNGRIVEQCEHAQ